MHPNIGADDLLYRAAASGSQWAANDGDDSRADCQRAASRAAERQDELPDARLVGRR
jgi:hypothetical protein